MSDNAAVIRDFVGAWARLDADELAAYFTDDGVYHNMPTAPVSGRAAVRDFIAGFTVNWTWTEWEIRALIADGDTVVCERIDRIRTESGDVDLPCVGVFELRGGQIAVWRDYFDLGTFMKAMGA